MELTNKRTPGKLILNILLLVILNIVLMSIIGYLTIDSFANDNSRVGAFLLSFFIPIFIVFLTQKMNNLERLIKFGSGIVLYIIIALFVAPTDVIAKCLIPCLLIGIATLYFGNMLLQKLKMEKDY